MATVAENLVNSTNSVINSLMQDEFREAVILSPFDRNSTSLVRPSEQVLQILLKDLTAACLDTNHLAANNAAIAWIKKTPPSMAHLLLLTKLITIVKLQLVEMLIKSVPLVLEEQSYWVGRRGSLWTLGIYSIQTLPRQWLATSSAPLERHGGSSSFADYFSFAGVRKSMRSNIKGLSRLANIQAQCLGLLARPRLLYDPISSTVDVSNYMEGIRDPLQTYIHDEISLLETVCSSLYELEMSTSMISEQFENNLFVHIAATRLETVTGRIDSLNVQFKGLLSRYQRPQLIEQYWFPAFAAAASTIWLHRAMTFSAFGKMMQDGLMNAMDTLQSFWKSWILLPVLDILNTIRHKESKLAIMGSLSLSSDLESLERMVVAFAKDHAQSANLNQDELERQVRSGDLSAVLQEYENDIKKPVRSLVGGSLIRSLLIQVQKAKVDGAFALSALDKLLKSNELNFAFLAVIPTLLISYSVFQYLKSLTGSAARHGLKKARWEANIVIRDVERLLVQGERSDESVGYLLCHLVHLDRLLRAAPYPAKQKEVLLQDLIDLEKSVLERSHWDALAHVADTLRNYFPKLANMGDFLGNNLTINKGGPTINRRPSSLGASNLGAESNDNAASRRASHVSKNSKVSKQVLPSELVKVDNITKHSFWEELNYKLDVLVPTNEEKELNVPIDSYLQQVHYGEKAKWRVVRNQDYNLPPYMTEHKEQETIYHVIVQEKKFFGALELGSPFLKKWDALSLFLLLYTASLTPFETAFIVEETLNIDVRFLINYCVDFIFFYDMFVQMRTPYRDPLTGKLILDVKQISYAYLTSWFPLDIMSVLPFDAIQYAVPKPAVDTTKVENGEEAENLGELGLLKFIRLTRLLKLLRVVRANRKLKQAQISSGMRYFTLELLKMVITIIFLIHWFACGYRLVADPQAPSDPIGWLKTYELHLNHTANIPEAYFAALYWSSATLSLVGCSNQYITPSCAREFIYATLVQTIGFLIALYYIARLSSMTNATGEISQAQDILVDNYLAMFDDLRLDPRLKFTVYQHLNDHFAEQANQRQADMLKALPKGLRSFISTEIFLDFILHVPYLETFVDRQPLMIQDFCMVIERKMIPANNFLFTEGMDGIYQIEEGIVAMEGVVYTSGSIIGLTVLRERIKSVECRALTDIKCNFLSRKCLIEILDHYPKVKYYCKRWTQWQLLRQYIMTYTKLYFMAARRGALMNPPLYSRRPNMDENEEDDIDIAVLDHIEEQGY